MSAFLTKTGSHCSVNLAFVPVSEVILGVGLSPAFGGGRAGYSRYFSALHLGGLYSSCRGKTKSCQLVNHANKKFNS